MTINIMFPLFSVPSQIPVYQWKQRNILLPLPFEPQTAHMMATIFRSLPFGMDPAATITKADQFPAVGNLCFYGLPVFGKNCVRANSPLIQQLPDNSSPTIATPVFHNYSLSPPKFPPLEQTDQRMMERNTHMLNLFKNCLIKFITENFLEDVIDYELDNYANRYFYLHVRYFDEPESDPPIWIVAKDAPSDPKESPVEVVAEESNVPIHCTNFEDPNFRYWRSESAIISELLYTTIPSVFGIFSPLELMYLELHETMGEDGTTVG